MIAATVPVDHTETITVARIGGVVLASLICTRIDIGSLGCLSRANLIIVTAAIIAGQAVVVAEAWICGNIHTALLSASGLNG